jgi:hypothetical protein
MPLPKRVSPPGDEDHLSLIDRALSAFQWGQWTKPGSSSDEIPRVGKYKADYSELKPEEIAADAGCEELFRNSKPVSR